MSRGEQEGLGPICQAVAELDVDEAVLLSNYPATETRAYRSWLAKRFPGAITLAGSPFKNPTQFGIIYRQAVDAVSDALGRWKKKGNNPELVFHLSPGTPAMAAVWIILWKTRFPAGLIQSSQQFGVETVSVPFDISAEFIPDLLRASDEELQRQSVAQAPKAPEFDAIQRKCAQMEQLVARAKKVAYRSVPVLIEGESGTGKELFAAAIHNRIRACEYPQFLLDSLPLKGERIESVLRLDHIQPIGRHHDSFTPTEHRLSDDAIDVLDEWLEWLRTGELGDDTMLAVVRSIAD